MSTDRQTDDRRRWNLDDWKGVIPQTAQRVGTSMTEKAYLPFKDFGRSAEGTVTAYLAMTPATSILPQRCGRWMTCRASRLATTTSTSIPRSSRAAARTLAWPAGVRRYSYRKDFEVPSGNGKHNVQIAFNVLPPEKKALLPFPAGTMPRFCAY